MVFKKSLPKINTPKKKNQTRYQDRGINEARREIYALPWLKITGKEWLPQLPKGGEVMPLTCERGRNLPTKGKASPLR